MEKTNQIYGIRAVLEAIRAGKDIDKVFFQKGLRGALFSELENEVRSNSISYSYVPPEKLNRLTQNNHQGVVAMIAPVKFHDLEELIEKTIDSGKTPLFLLLDQLSDVRNFGAIIRTAECSGVDGIIIQKKGGAPINADTVKTSAGAVYRVPICKVDHLKDAIYLLQASGISIVAATEKSDQLLYELPFDKSVAIVMGSEGKGISSSILKMADHRAKLPMLGEIDSLNVSVACALFLYEAVRQRL